MKITLSSCLKFIFMTSFWGLGNYFQAGAQSYGNLVPNPSFEVYDTCPDNTRGINNAVGWFNLCDAAGEYFNSCFTGSTGLSWGVPQNSWGEQFPLTGNAYAYTTGVITEISGREYIGCKLIQPLKVGKKYCVLFNVSLSETSSSAVDKIGLLLSDSGIICPPSNPPTCAYCPPVLSNYTPQIESQNGFILIDTVNWYPISGTYIAHGGEQYLTIGGFVINDSINWVFRHPYWSHWFGYYIDNVSVYECSNAPQPANAGNDTIICLGDSIQLGTTNFLDYQYLWLQKGHAPDTTAQPWVHPLKTTTYYLWQTDFDCTTTRDSITIRVKDCEPKAAAGPDVEICRGDSIQHQAILHPNSSLSWLNAAKDTLHSQNPWVKPHEPTWYYLVQKDKYDSISIDSILISIKECIKPLEIANVITPNADGKNDILVIQNPGEYPFIITIFNRWGNQVFKGDNTHPWDGKQDGKEVPDGVYFYQVTAITPKGLELRYQGVVHVIK